MILCLSPSSLSLTFLCFTCLFSTDRNDIENKIYSEKACQKLIDKVTPDSPLPNECNKFPTVVKTLQRRNSNRSDQAKAFAGMSPGDMAAAMAARERGHLNHAQVQRRLTTNRRR